MTDDPQPIEDGYPDETWQQRIRELELPRWPWSDPLIRVWTPWPARGPLLTLRAEWLLANGMRWEKECPQESAGPPTQRYPGCLLEWVGVDRRDPAAEPR